jgi:hypothetical protein
MYQDIKGLVTVGVGNLIDPVGQAKELPFRWKNKPGLKNPGMPASKADIEAEWKKIKDDPTLALKGHRACEGITNLELSGEAIDALIAKRLQENETYLIKQANFKNFDKWPADAQMAVLSMAWAMGPGGPPQFKTMAAACEKLDFDKAAANCRIDETGNPGIVPRNRADKLLFENAAAVVAAEIDFSVLYYPQIVLKPVIITAD